MTTTIKTLTFLVIVILMSSFANKNSDQFIGTYGVSASDPAQIKLIINSDHTYYYQDFSFSNKKIVAKGNWRLRGNKVVLMDNEIKFHNVWAFEKNGEVAKSRKGITFYRLCKMDQ
ncbi:MAG: hypothetical protein IPP32_00880 [Bacteroidetes bacterium]|nr:hypothetical protein [Bacteroidota bacterium]